MRFFKTALISIFSLSLLLIISCNDDDGGEKLIGSMSFVTITNGPIDSNHMYLMTFSDLVGDLEYPDGIEIGANDEKTVVFNRVGEQLTVYLSNLPDNCPASEVSSASTTGSQWASGGTPNDPKHPEAEYQSIIVIPLDGSTGNLTFTIECN